jgi:hypothetical protein
MQKLNSLKQLLLRKSENISISNLLNAMGDEAFVELVQESLIKMARASHKGRTANKAVRDFALEMDPEIEPNMIHDALSHHASQYKAALARNDQELANQHAKKLFNTVDMADMAQGHSNGKLMISAPSVQPWERHQKSERFADRIAALKDKESNNTISDSEKQWLSDNPVTKGNKKPNNFVSDTKGWKYRGSDYSFLQHPPHESADNETRKTGHNGAYPIEHIRVNGKYLDIKDVPSDQLKGHEDHPFDHHPIMRHFDEPVTRRTPERDAQFAKEHEEYKASPHMDQYFDKMQQMEEENPEAFAARGKTKSDPVHTEIKQPSTGSIPEPTADANDVISKLSPEIQARLKAKLGAPKPQPAQQEAPKAASPQDINSAMSSLPPEMQARLKAKMGI